MTRLPPPHDPEAPRPSERDERDAVDLADVSPEELLAAAQLRDGLAQAERAERTRGARRIDLAARAGEDVELLLAIRHAVHPAPLDADRHEAILARALASAPGRRSVRRRWAYGAVSVGGTLALAAGALLVVVELESPERAALGVREATSPSSQVAAMAPCRSASELFDAQFPVTGGTSNRIDCIALARERDLRGNLFAQWQVK